MIHVQSDADDECNVQREDEHRRDLHDVSTKPRQHLFHLLCVFDVIEWCSSNHLSSTEEDSVMAEDEARETVAVDWRGGYILLWAVCLYYACEREKCGEMKDLRVQCIRLFTEFSGSNVFLM